MRRVHVIVAGTVQGVGYRWALRAEAALLGVTGWVRNRHDGTVEADLEGPDAVVAEILEWMAKGPPGAHVSHVRTSEEQPRDMTGFEILRTA